jgi:PAS domain S-box-containing protein
VAVITAIRSGQARRTSFDNILTTSLSLAEEKFRALAENSPDMIERFDREAKHLYVNQAALRLYGKPAGSIIGNPVEETRLPGPYVSLLKERIQRVFETAQPTELEHYIPTEKGTTFDPETRRKFGVIQENAEKMGQLIDNLLRLSLLGRAELHRSKLDIGGIVHEVIQEIRMAEPEREWVTEIGDLPAAHGDRLMVRQLLANLLSNAVKFTRGNQGARIEVGSFERSGERVYYVKDNGVGFDMKYYNKLFGVFQRLVSERQFEGTGVGLSIVQRIVQRHGGRVWAEGQMQGGATFYFTLPPKEQG